MIKNLYGDAVENLKLILIKRSKTPQLGKSVPQAQRKAAGPIQNWTGGLLKLIRLRNWL
ncbi:hypothetical protein OBV_29000 [Oscillibacter valericigenes Sjm18-20]|nr:hypothetical protein OBV_29000 [Oscillibacter valericigenes Sjm18-20]